MEPVVVMCTPKWGYKCALLVTVYRLNCDASVDLQYIRILRDPRDLTVIRERFPKFPTLEFDGNDRVMQRADNEYLYIIQYVEVL